MRLAVPKETAPGERRVALVPETVSRLSAAGFEVHVARDAGAAAGFSDADYAEAGAQVVDAASVLADAEAVAACRSPQRTRSGRLARGRFSSASSSRSRTRRESRGSRGRRGRFRDGVDPTDHARAADGRALLAGDGGGLQGRPPAADRVPKLFPMLMTAAGTIAPVRALVIGAASRPPGDRNRTAARGRGLGVRRPAGGEGAGREPRASFLDLGVRTEETEGGYARELSAEEQAQQQAALEERIPDFDVVITTAAVPGRPAPKLIPGSAVDGMRAVRDRRPRRRDGRQLRADGARRGHRARGVTVDGHDEPAVAHGVPREPAYSRNVAALLQHLAPDGELELDWDDEITAGACVTRPEDAA